MEQVRKTPVALVAMAWLLVGIPWAWGVTQLWKNAQKLFQSPPPAATAPAATKAPAAMAPAAATPATAPK